MLIPNSLTIPPPILPPVHHKFFLQACELEAGGSDGGFYFSFSGLQSCLVRDHHLPVYRDPWSGLSQL